jgi:hypothetical protein
VAITVEAPERIGDGMDVVLYAKDATVASGWIVTPDATAAGGARLQNPNAAAAKISTPLASPAKYFEMSFNARAGVGYRLWIRATAIADYWANDSAHVQFDGSVDEAGRPAYRIGTTSATTYTLEDCTGCGLAGWGWQDNAVGAGALGPLVYFAQTGPQRIRVQVREDGLGIDQILLSADRYLTAAPGATKNDGVVVPPPQQPGTEVVLYAKDATVAGAWAVTGDGTAAGGARLQSPNAGAGKIGTALAAPANYFELTFDARANTAYRLWMRGTATENHWANDSAYVQFDGSVDENGVPLHRIGTASAMSYTLEDCTSCGVSGWGWQDNAIGAGALGPVVYFAQDGPQRIRVQVREDGLGIDQIVLSAERFLIEAPGQTKNDATILSR